MALRLVQEVGEGVVIVRLAPPELEGPKDARRLAVACRRERNAETTPANSTKATKKSTTPSILFMVELIEMCSNFRPSYGYRSVLARGTRDNRHGRRTKNVEGRFLLKFRGMDHEFVVRSRFLLSYWYGIPCGTRQMAE
jgi:hypothetical protein